MGSPDLTPVIQHLLLANVHQSRLSQEMAQDLHITTQELLTLWQLTPAITTPLPTLTHEDQCLLNKLSWKDDIEVFLDTFKHVACRESWPIRDWAHAIGPLLTGDTPCPPQC